MSELTKTKRLFVLLDRDGTVMIDKVYQKNPDLTELFPHAAAGLRKLTDAGFGLVLVTNQSGIARGYLTLDDLNAVNGRLSKLLSEAGCALAGIYHCPHLPEDNCRCRKPMPGMAEAAASELDFDLRESIMIGDRDCDIEMGKAVGAKTILVRTGGGRETEQSGQVHPDYIADDLLDAANWILGNLGFSKR